MAEEYSLATLKVNQDWSPASTDLPKGYEFDTNAFNNIADAAGVTTESATAGTTTAVEFYAGTYSGIGNEGKQIFHSFEGGTLTFKTVTAGTSGTVVEGGKVVSTDGQNCTGTILMLGERADSGTFNEATAEKFALGEDSDLTVWQVNTQKYGNVLFEIRGDLTTQSTYLNHLATRTDVAEGASLTVDGYWRPDDSGTCFRNYGIMNVEGELNLKLNQLGEVSVSGTSPEPRILITAGTVTDGNTAQLNVDGGTVTVRATDMWNILYDPQKTEAEDCTAATTLIGGSAASLNISNGGLYDTTGTIFNAGTVTISNLGSSEFASIRAGTFTNVVGGSIYIGPFDITYEASGVITVDMTGATENAYVLISATEGTYGELGKDYMFVDGKDCGYTLSVANNCLYAIKNTAVLTVKANDAEKVYDGDPLTTGETEYTIVSGTLTAGDELTVKTSSSLTDAGSTANTIESVTIMRGEDNVTGLYEIAKLPGTLTVTKRQATLTSEGDWKLFDNTPLTVDTVTAGEGDFVKDEGFTYTVTGSQKEIGTSYNTFTYTLNDGTKEGNYDIKQVFGELTVYKSETLAADADLEGTAETTVVTVCGEDFHYKRNAYASIQEALAMVVEGRTETLKLGGGTNSLGTAGFKQDITVLTEKGAIADTIAVLDGTLTLGSSDLTVSYLTVYSVAELGADTELTVTGEVVNNERFLIDADAKFASGTWSGDGTIGITGNIIDSSYKIVDLASGTIDTAKVSGYDKEDYEVIFDGNYDLILRKKGAEEVDQTVGGGSISVDSGTTASTYVAESITGTDDNKDVVINAGENSEELKIIGSVTAGEDGDVTISNSGEDVKITRDVTADGGSVTLITDGTAEETTITVAEKIESKELIIENRKENGTAIIDSDIVAETVNVSSTGNSELNIIGGTITAGTIATSETSEGGAVTIADIKAETVDIIHAGANTLNVTNSVTVTGEDSPEGVAAAKIQNITKDADLKIAANVYVKNATLEIRNETNQELQATGKLEVADIRIFNNDWTSATKVGEIKITQQIEAAGKLEITNANLTETEGVVDSGTISLGTQVHSAKTGMTIVNKTANVINGGYKDDGTEEAANITIESGDVRIDNDGHLNINVTAVNSDLAITNTSANTLTGSYTAKNVDLANISGGAVRSGTVTAIDTLTISGTGTIEQGSKLSAANVTITADAVQSIDVDTQFSYTGNWSNSGSINLSVDETTEGSSYHIITGAGTDWGSINLTCTDAAFILETKDDGLYLVRTSASDPVIDGNTLNLTKAGAYDSLTIRNGGTLNVEAAGVTLGTLSATAGTDNVLAGEQIAAATVAVSEGAELVMNKDQYDSFMALSSFQAAGALKIVPSVGNALQISDVDALMAKDGVSNVQFQQDLIDIDKLNIKLTKSAVIGFDNGYGTTKSDTIRFYTGTSVTFGREDRVLNLEEGSNKIQIDKSAQTTILSDLTNVSTVKAAAASTVEMADITFQLGRNATLKAEGVFKAGTITGTDKKTTLTIGKSATFTAGAIALGEKSDKLSVGKSASFTAAGNVVSADTISLGAYSNSVFAGIDGTKKLTLSSGKSGQIATLKAVAVTGTTANDSFSFGNYNDTDLTSLDFGAGNDTLKIGNYADADVTGALTFGEGTDKLTIGKGASLTVSNLDVDSLEKLSMSKNAMLYLGTDAQVKAAQAKWSKYSSQIAVAQIA